LNLLERVERDVELTKRYSVYIASTATTTAISANITSIATTATTEGKCRKLKLSGNVHGDVELQKTHSEEAGCQKGASVVSQEWTSIKLKFSG